MDFDDTMQHAKPAERRGLEPRSLDFIERISYFERLGSLDAVNDNASKSDAEGASCFESWALPDYIKS